MRAARHGCSGAPQRSSAQKAQMPKTTTWCTRTGATRCEPSRAARPLRRTTQQVNNLDHSRRSRYALTRVRSTNAEPGCVMSATAGAMAAEDRDFSFPFPAYAIQNDLMRHIYATLDAGGVGVFESPTGTVRRFAACCISWTHDIRSVCALRCHARACAERSRRCIARRARR